MNRRLHQDSKKVLENFKMKYLQPMLISMPQHVMASWRPLGQTSVFSPPSSYSSSPTSKAAQCSQFRIRRRLKDIEIEEQEEEKPRPQQPVFSRAANVAGAAVVASMSAGGAGNSGTEFQAF